MNKNWGLTPSEIPETIYGHKKRLLWIIEQLQTLAPDRPKSDISILEIGCGTGVMISIPLASLGYDVTGVDTDDKSIELAKAVNPFKNAHFLCIDAAVITSRYDFIILAEVLEHMDAPQSLITLSRDLLKDSGRLLVSVPNGYGSFEIEQFIWAKLRLGKALEKLKVDWLIGAAKWKLKGWEESPYLSSLSSSPHVQRFTLGRIIKMIKTAGFHVEETRGSTLLAGKISNLLFTGFVLPLKLNNFLGSILKPVASNYYLKCRKIV
jgi:SAM-dependent methyltransferase